MPLLFETGHAADFDRVVVTACGEAQQIERLVARGLSEDAAWQRVRAQLPTADKVAKADFVIRTDGSFEGTDRQIDDVVAILTKPLPL